jgi:DNA-binding winged helix-turn-helix (wHTH) protein
MPTSPGAASVALLDRPRQPILAFGPFTFDPNSQVLRRAQDDVTVPPRVLAVLELLLRRAGDLVSRQELIESVWKDAFVTDTSLAEAVSLLRQTLGDDRQSPTYIQTVHRRGYRFVAPVEVRTEPTQPVASTPSPPAVSERVYPSIGGQLVPWSAASLFAALAIAAVWQMFARNTPTPPLARFVLQLDAGTELDDRAPALALSPDGTHAAWSACAARDCRLYVRPLASLSARPVPGSDDASGPFFSPDGRWIGFFAGGKLKKVSLAGGSPVSIADVTIPYGAVWTREDYIIFGGTFAAGLMRVPAEGGRVEPVTVPRHDQGEVRHAWPSLSPGGTLLLFTVGTSLDDDAPGSLAAARLDRGRLVTWTPVLGGVGVARAAADDVVAVSRGTELQAAMIDPLRLSLVGVPQTVAPVTATATHGSHFAVSSTGSLLLSAAGTKDASGDGLSWWTRTGTPLPDGIRQVDRPVLSPDGGRIAYTSGTDPSRSDVWVADVQRGAVTRLTHDGTNISPVWSHDGRSIYFARREQGAFGLVSVSADGGSAETLSFTDRHAFPASTSADGKTLAFVQPGAGTCADIWAIELERGGVVVRWCRLRSTTSRQLFHRLIPLWLTSRMKQGDGRSTSSASRTAAARWCRPPVASGLSGREMG